MKARLELIENLVEHFCRESFHCMGFMHLTQSSERGVEKRNPEDLQKGYL